MTGRTAKLWGCGESIRQGLSDEPNIDAFECQRLGVKEADSVIEHARRRGLEVESLALSTQARDAHRSESPTRIRTGLSALIDRFTTSS